MADEPDLMERMVQLSRARADHRECIELADQIGEPYGLVGASALPYIELLEAECKRVGIMFDEPA